MDRPKLMNVTQSLVRQWLLSPHSIYIRLLGLIDILASLTKVDQNIFI